MPSAGRRSAATIRRKAPPEGCAASITGNNFRAGGGAAIAPRLRLLCRAYPSLHSVSISADLLSKKPQPVKAAPRHAGAPSD